MASHFQPRFETDSRASQKSPIIFCVGEPSNAFGVLWMTQISLWIAFGILIWNILSAQWNKDKTHSLFETYLHKQSRTEKYKFWLTDWNVIISDCLLT